MKNLEKYLNIDKLHKLDWDKLDELVSSKGDIYVYIGCQGLPAQAFVCR